MRRYPRGWRRRTSTPGIAASCPFIVALESAERTAKARRGSGPSARPQLRRRRLVVGPLQGRSRQRALRWPQGVEARSADGGSFLLLGHPDLSLLLGGEAIEPLELLASSRL